MRNAVVEYSRADVAEIRKWPGSRVPPLAGCATVLLPGEFGTSSLPSGSGILVNDHLATIDARQLGALSIPGPTGMMTESFTTQFEKGARQLQELGDSLLELGETQRLEAYEEELEHAIRAELA